MAQVKHPKKMTITLKWKDWCFIRILCLDSWIAHNSHKTDETPDPAIYSDKWLNRADKIVNRIEKEGELRGVEFWSTPYKEEE